MQAVEQPVDQLRALDEVSHEQEERDRDQHVVRHDAVSALHEEVEDLPIRERRVDAAVVQPSEDDAHAHQGERGRKPEHDADTDECQHQQSEIAVGEMRPRRQHDHWDHDQRDQRKTKPQFLAYLHLLAPRCTTNASSFWISSSLTCTISFSLSTSTSCTSSWRDGHSPRLIQMMQRMISTIPCIRISAPATGITVLNG